MKQTAVDVLMYLFENFIEDETVIDPHRHELLDELEQLGFPLHEIRKAFNWLEELIQVQDSLRSPRKTTSIRIYSDLEKQLLDIENKFGYINEVLIYNEMIIYSFLLIMV